jgi:2-methylcitrate dehydratase PrpD
MNASRALAELAIETSVSDLGEAADTATRHLILDTLGTAIAGWQAPGMAAVVRSMGRWGGTPEATLWAYGGKLPTPNAAFANSCMVHAMDYDDVHHETSLHLMSSLLPATLAVAEMRHCSGRELMTAVALGIEVAVRIGLVAKAQGMPYGYLPSSTIGAFGVTAACCRLLGLDVDQTVNALGIAYAQASGNRQGLLDFTLTKRIQPALAARSALWAAFLAADGITGPHRALEGEAGFFKLYVGCEAPDAAELADPRDFWEVERVSIKRYPACGAIAPSTQAAIELATEQDLKLEEIAEVYLDLGHANNFLVGHPWQIGTDPQVNAQFSVRYGVALGLVRRRAGLDQFTTDSVLGDQEVADVASRVQIREIPNTEGLRTDQIRVTVTVVTRDGHRLTGSAQLIKGDWREPFSFDEVVDKFNECVEFSNVWPVEQASAIVEAVRRLETMPAVSMLSQELLVVEGA